MNVEYTSLEHLKNILNEISLTIETSILKYKV